MGFKDRVRQAVEAWDEKAPPGWEKDAARAPESGEADAAPFPDAALLGRIANATMPFGKYKGRLLIDLPEAYVLWFAHNGYPDGELGRLLAALYEIKANGLETFLRPLVEARPPLARR